MSISVYPLKVARQSLINYCHLVMAGNRRDAIIIDPAWEQGKIEEKILQTNCRLKAILLTNSHPDDVDLASYFADKYNVKALIAKIEIDYYGFKCPNLQPIESNESIY